MSLPKSIKTNFVPAIKGILFLFRSERNAQIHMAATVAVVILGFWLEVSLLEWSVLILTITMVLTAEAINTAIENLVDMVSPEFNPQAGLIKDISAGAVLLSAMGAAIVGIIVFGPKIIDWFNQ